MKKTTVLMLALILLPVLSAYPADNVVVIVNDGNTQDITARTVKAIYSDNVITWADGTKIIVYDLKLGALEREVFSEEILGTSAEQAAILQSKKKSANSLQNPPKIKRTRLVVSLVAKKAAAIGYVPQSAIEGKKGIRVILTIEK